MNWLDYKQKFEPSKNWIISNQSSSGAIFWDEKVNVTLGIIVNV